MKFKYQHVKLHLYFQQSMIISRYLQHPHNYKNHINNLQEGEIVVGSVVSQCSTLLYFVSASVHSSWWTPLSAVAKWWFVCYDQHSMFSLWNQFFSPTWYQSQRMDLFLAWQNEKSSLYKLSFLWLINYLYCLTLQKEEGLQNSCYYSYMQMRCYWPHSLAWMILTTKGFFICIQLE